MSLTLMFMLRICGCSRDKHSQETILTEAAFLQNDSRGDRPISREKLRYVMPHSPTPSTRPLADDCLSDRIK